MRSIEDHMQFQPGPCSMCGATNYPLSFGGANICPACDCGVPPAVSQYQREIAQLKAEKLELVEACKDMLRVFNEWDRRAIEQGLEGQAAPPRSDDWNKAKSKARSLIAKHTKEP